MEANIPLPRTPLLDPTTPHTCDEVLQVLRREINQVDNPTIQKGLQRVRTFFMKLMLEKKPCDNDQIDPDVTTIINLARSYEYFRVLLPEQQARLRIETTRASSM